MSDQAPVAALEAAEAEAPAPLPRRPQARTRRLWDDLLADPVRVLGRAALEINRVPPVLDGSQTNLWFAAGPEGDLMVIDPVEQTAATSAGWRRGENAAIEKRMVVSHMRHNEIVPRKRRARTRIVDAGVLTSDLWVTEMQSGCTVLIVDWGDGRYSLTHLQPYKDEQSNWLGRAVMGLGGYTKRVTGEAFFKNVYKNQWLKWEASSVVAATDGTPRNYIMVQSMFESSRRRTTQIVGVRRENTFVFYRQSTRARDYQVTELRWTAWNEWRPFWSY